ncbi:MAG TPA: hypothetical protein VHB27_15675 [Rhodopila sp.]|uniref:hypothetical protein n=1 Tax=Rhodopila sp. TaxID=2480087 RepID=UPI002CA31A3C|nr:hypothetical protein [Rhodopila sp.]HVY16664.1 hypothetical protein [Rhodopila sp.]
MYEIAESTLTLATLLRDPLVQLVMRSDNVSEKDHAELLYRVKGTLELRSLTVDPTFEVMH